MAPVLALPVQPSPPGLPHISPLTKGSLSTGDPHTHQHGPGVHKGRGAREEAICGSGLGDNYQVGEELKGMLTTVMAVHMAREQLKRSPTAATEVTTCVAWKEQAKRLGMVDTTAAGHGNLPGIGKANRGRVPLSSGYSSRTLS